MSYQFELLETRLLLAASLGVRQKGANLMITGSGQADSIEVLGTGAGSVQVSIDLNGDGDFGDPDEVRTFTGVKNLKINTGAGGDRVLVDGLNIAGKFQLNTGAGNDIVAIGSISPNQVGGKANLNLGGGDDSLYVEDTSVNGKVTINGGGGINTVDDAGGNSFPSNSKIKSVQPGDVPPPPPGGGGVIPPVAPGTPVAVNDEYTVLETNVLTGNLLTNDTDDGTPLPLTLIRINGQDITNGEVITLPNGAQLTINTDGTFSLDSSNVNPPPGGQTSTAFSYTISDGIETSTAIATIHIQDVPNVGPSAVTDLVTTDENTALIFDVRTNDIDVDSPGALKVTHINGIALVVNQPFTLASGATVTLNANGTLTYNPNGKYSDLTPSGNPTAVDQFTYTVTDGHSADSAIVQVTVTGATNPPQAQNDLFRRNEQDFEFSAVGGNQHNMTLGNIFSDNGGFGADTDSDSTLPGDVWIASVESGGNFVNTPDGSGWLTVTTSLGATARINYLTGQIQYDSSPTGFNDPSNPLREHLFDYLTENQVVVDTIEYTLEDADGNLSTATISIEITGRNDAPDVPDRIYAVDHAAANITGNLLTEVVAAADIEDHDLRITRIIGATAYMPTSGGAPIGTEYAITVNQFGGNTAMTLRSGGASPKNVGVLTVDMNGNFSFNPTEDWNGATAGTSQVAAIIVSFEVMDELNSAVRGQLVITVSGTAA